MGIFKRLKKQQQYCAIYSELLLAIEGMRYTAIILYSASFGGQNIKEQLKNLLFDEGQDPRDFELPNFTPPPTTDVAADIYNVVSNYYNRAIFALPEKFRYVDPQVIVPLRPPLAHFSLKNIEYQPCKVVQNVLDWVDACFANQPKYAYGICAPLAGFMQLPVPTWRYYTEKIAARISRGKVLAYSPSTGQYEAIFEA